MFLKDHESGGLDILARANVDRWDTSLVARHRVRDRVDAIASLEAGSKWGEPVAWAATAGLKVRW